MKQKVRTSHRKRAISIPDLQRRLIRAALKRHRGNRKGISGELRVGESIVKGEARKIRWRFCGDSCPYRNDQPSWAPSWGILRLPRIGEKPCLL